MAIYAYAAPSLTAANEGFEVGRQKIRAFAAERGLSIS